MGRTAIRCNCGQRIGQKEVMQTGYYPRMFGPSFVYVRFRCSRCKKLGEQFVKQEEWESGILKDATVETSTNEKQRFEELGPIQMQELVDFHKELENLGDLSGLNKEFGKPEGRSETDNTGK
jgi:hypothetical protein